MSKQLLEEWKKREPLLSDIEGFQRLLEAHELKQLIRLGHPNDHGEPFTRWQVMKAIEERGMQIVEDLGWPTAMNSHYKNRYTGKICTLKEILTQFDADLDPLRREMLKLEDRLNELTNGEFYGGLAGRGLETFRVTELRKIAKKHSSGEFDKILRKGVLLHKGFYEQYHKRLLTDDGLKRDECVQNILSQARWLGIPIEEPVPESRLPPKRFDSALFSVLGHWEPTEEKT